MSKILVVDDEARDLRIIELFLTELGKTPILCQDPNKALTVLQQDKDIDLVLLDLQMPGLHGSELMQKIQQHHFYIPVIIVSSDSTAASTVKLTKDGAEDYIWKPVDPERFKDVVKRRNGPIWTAAISAV